jgi:hypothetical protein
LKERRATVGYLLQDFKKNVRIKLSSGTEFILAKLLTFHIIQAAVKNTHEMEVLAELQNREFRFNGLALSDSYII